MKSGMIGSGKLPIDYLIFLILNKLQTFHHLKKMQLVKGVIFQLIHTPYYSQHIENSALRKTIIPQFEECKLHQGEWDDPLGEENHRVTNHLIHTYPDKVLFLATVFCSTYCRYCTRSRIVGKPQDNRSNYEDTYRYIEEHKEIRDVLISGGDPLTLTDGALEKNFNTFTEYTSY